MFIEIAMKQIYIYIYIHIYIYIYTQCVDHRTYAANKLCTYESSQGWFPSEVSYVCCAISCYYPIKVLPPQKSNGWAMAT